MFAYVHWDGDFDDTVKAALPAQQPWAWFLPKAIVFRVPSVGAFVDTRAQLTALARADSAFTFAISIHSAQDSFGGFAHYSRPGGEDPAFGDIMA